MVKFCEYTACTTFTLPIGDTEIPKRFLGRIDNFKYRLDKPRNVFKEEVIRQMRNELNKDNLIQLAFLMTGKKIFDEDETDEYTFRGEVFSLFKPEYTMPLRFYILQSFSLMEILLLHSGRNKNVLTPFNRLCDKINKMVKENALYPFILKFDWDIETETLSIYYYAEVNENKYNGG